MFELASCSTKKPRKNRNGDQVLTRRTEGGSALLVLADGIGGRPCDWKASDVACEILADTLEERSGTLGERLEAGVEAAHRRVQKEMGRCEGMLAALVALACEPETEEVFFIGVGDARIYRLPAGRGAPQQLTSDDITAERVEPDLPGAKPYLRRMLTRAVGGRTSWAWRSSGLRLRPTQGWGLKLIRPVYLVLWLHPLRVRFHPHLSCNSRSDDLCGVQVAA